MLDRWPEASKLDRGRIGFFGFSRGAYTGMVIAGEVSWWRLDILWDRAALRRRVHRRHVCRDREGQVSRSAAGRVILRFAAAVLADLEFGRAFTLEGLADVKVPIQLWASERGGDGVLPEDNEAIDENLPAKPDYRVVPHAGHFAFIVPCSAEAAKALPEICVDAGGVSTA